MKQFTIIALLTMSLIVPSLALAKNKLIMDNHFTESPIDGHVACQDVINDYVKPFTQSMIMENGTQHELVYRAAIYIDETPYSGYDIDIYRIDNGLNELEANAKFIFDYSNRVFPCTVIGFSFSTNEY